MCAHLPNYHTLFDLMFKLKLNAKSYNVNAFQNKLPLRLSFYTFFINHFPLTRSFECENKYFTCRHRHTPPNRIYLTLNKKMCSTGSFQLEYRILNRFSTTSSGKNNEYNLIKMQWNGIPTQSGGFSGIPFPPFETVFQFIFQ